MTDRESMKAFETKLSFLLVRVAYFLIPVNGVRGYSKIYLWPKYR